MVEFSLGIFVFSLWKDKFWLSRKWPTIRGQSHLVLLHYWHSNLYIEWVFGIIFFSFLVNNINSLRFYYSTNKYIRFWFSKNVTLTFKIFVNSYISISKENYVLFNILFIVRMLIIFTDTNFSWGPQSFTIISLGCPFFLVAFNSLVLTFCNT